MLEEPTQKDHGVKSLIASMGRILTVLQQNFVNLALVQHFFRQIFYFINAALFNEIMLRRDLCTSTYLSSFDIQRIVYFSVQTKRYSILVNTGMNIKMKISVLNEFTKKPENKDWVGDCHKGNNNDFLYTLCRSISFIFSFLLPNYIELEPLRQLVSVLLLNKTIIQDKEVRKEVCPLINPVQLKQLLSLYQPDELLEEPIPVTIQSIDLQKILISILFVID